MTFEADLSMLRARGTGTLEKLAKVRVRAEDGVLTVGGSRVRLRSAFLVRAAGDRVLVEIARGPYVPPFMLEVSDDEQARALLEALGMAPSQWRTSFRGLGLGVPLMGANLLGAIALAGYFAAALVLDRRFWEVAMVLAFVLPIWAALLWPARIEVGTDGVVVRSLRGSRFFAVRDIADVKPYSVTTRFEDVTHGVEVVLRTGEHVRLPIAAGNTIGPRRASAVLERIRGVIRAEDRGAEPEAALLTRRERDARAWVARLRRPGASDDGAYRGTDVPPTTLERVLEDPLHPPEARAAAAVALAAADPTARVRIANVSAATVEPRLRVALDVASRKDATDDELADALDKVAGEL